MASRLVITAIVVLLASPLAVALLPVPNPTPNDPLPGASSTDPAVVGVWEAPFEGKVPAVSMAMMGDGSIVYWSGVEAAGQDEVFFLSHPVNSSFAVLSPPYNAASVSVQDSGIPDGDLFCAGQTILGDGKLLVAGGSSWQDITDPNYNGFVSGRTETYVYDPATKAWSDGGDMGWSRWYPTIMTGADGNAIAAGGIDHLVEPQTMIDQVETYDGSAWHTIATSPIPLPMYPRVFTVPSGAMKGDLFYETSATLWGPFGEHPAEATWSLEQKLDPATGQFSFIGPSLFGARQHADTVMLPLDKSDDYTAKIMTFGGSIGRSLASTPLAETTTIGQDGSVTHALDAPLNHARWHANGVLLPDGTVLAVGGGMYDNVYAHGQPNPAVLVAEKYDPATNTWGQMAPMTVPRMYHSTALLLPDGRVLAGGHVPLPVPWTAFRDNVAAEAQVTETRFEIYEPPYLHWGATQPTISEIPSHVGFGQSFEVESPQADSVVDAMLVRAGATTHVWDTNERAIHLTIDSKVGDKLHFTTPPDGDVATPGPYMLFLRTSAPQGIVPGVAKFVNIS